LCRLSSPIVEFRFEIVAEKPTEYGFDDRVFSIGLLPYGSVEEALAAVSVLGVPTAPVWTPVWKHDDPQILNRTGALIDEISARAVATNLVLRTRDFRTFEACCTTSEKPPELDWFEFLDDAVRTSRRG
jgi:hypothetical protein